MKHKRRLVRTIMRIETDKIARGFKNVGAEEVGSGRLSSHRVEMSQ